MAQAPQSLKCGCTGNVISFVHNSTVSSQGKPVIKINTCCRTHISLCEKCPYRSYLHIYGFSCGCIVVTTSESASNENDRTMLHGNAKCQYHIQMIQIQTQLDLERNSKIVAINASYEALKTELNNCEAGADPLNLHYQAAVAFRQL